MIKRDAWIRIIRDFEENPFPEDLIEREQELPLDSKLKRAFAIIGPRRAGKTYCLFLLIKRLIESGVSRSSIVHVNFESMELAGAGPEDLQNFLDASFFVHPENAGKKTWFFLDEIQKADGWQSFIRTLLDKGKQVYVSGSSSKLLSKEIASQLRGRSITFEVFPLGFREFLAFKGFEEKRFFSTGEQAKMLALLEEFVLWGAYPEIVLEDSFAIKKKILNEILEVTIQRDVIERHKIRNGKVLKLMVKALANSKQFSVHKFFKFLQSNGIKVSKNTIYLYLQALNDCFAVFPLRKFAPSYKEEEQSVPKVYFVDPGLLQVYDINDISKAMETTVFSELLRRHGFDKTRYFKTLDFEVDFVIKGENKITELIQACYSLENFATKERETRALLKASKELGCNNLVVITWDYEAKELTGGKTITFAPLWKWLLGKA